ncbi:MAG: SMC-Scp complex subunit ScpB [Tissierellia bacterium]|nr:SMC-Scp complex subunit ScpB [Tissierellia bacterium]
MSSLSTKAKVEAFLFSWAEPVTVSEISEALSCSQEEVREALSQLTAELASGERGIRLVEFDDSYQFSTKPEAYAAIEAYAHRREEKRLSNAALETLAIIAYRQPVVKAEIEQVRGVRADRIVKSLLDAGLIQVLGEREAPGRPKIYGTTSGFLKKFGLKNLEQLPKIEPPEEQLEMEES